MAQVGIETVEKAFGAVRVLKGVSLAIQSGEFVSLVGPSGCGKTTLMRIVAGLEPVSGGRVLIGGEEMTKVRAADRDVAMVFQNYALYPHLTVAQNLAVPLAMRRLSASQRLPLIGRYLGKSAEIRREITKETQRTAEMLGIGHLMARKPAQLSGGQRQRVALGRAIVRHPKVFLMDEPLSNLDAALRVQMRTEIVALHRRVGASTIYVTHDQSEAMTMSDRVAVMMEGDLLQVGAPEEIYADPQDVRVAGFIGSPRINLLAGEAGEDGEVRVGNQPMRIETPARGPLSFAVRPEDLAPGPDGLACRIEQVEFLGDSLLLHARHIAGGEALIARLPAQARGGALAIGATLRLRPNPERALLFGADGKRLAAKGRAKVRLYG